MFNAFQLVTEGYTEMRGSDRKFSQAEMEQAFDAVCDKVNWKNSIAAVVPVDRIAVTVAAIVHFAGSPSFVKFDPHNEIWYVRAAGYYASIGA